MRYKAVSLAIAVLLIATPIRAQQKSYIVVETPRTTDPTTVITGQPFVQTYVVRFIDLTDLGERIIIQEETLKSYKKLGDFEVLDFSIDKQTKRREFLEHIWYLHYTLNIVDPKKMEYIIPPIDVPWKYKKRGQEENDPSILINSDFKTEEVHVTFVTTIPEKDPYLEIRDEINLGNFERQAWIWWTASWFLRIVPLALWLVTLIVFRRSLRKEAKTKDADVSEVSVGENIKNPSRPRAWFNLRMSIRRLKNCQMNSSGSKDDYLKAETKVVAAIKDFLRIKAPRLNVGSTPLIMAEFISANMNQYSTNKDALLQLARKAVAYQSDVEKRGEDYCRNPFIEAKELHCILSQLRFHRRMILFIKYSFVRIRNRLVKKVRKFRGRQ